jgi:predicted dithiol-disulfide oxidoreductase (DUF899 family)
MEATMTQYSFPGESIEYEQKRQELLAAEMALRDQVERVAQMRRALPLGKAVPDYVFREGPADLSRNDPRELREVRLSELFTDDRNELIVDHLMFAAGDEEPCVMCSMWADGYNAIAPHIERRANFVLIAKKEIGTLRDWARRRGWDRIRLLSSHDTTFNRDFGRENEDGSQNSGLSVFSRDPSGTIYHHYTIGADLPHDDASPYQGDGRGIDPHSPVWNLFDLLPSGRGDWYPSHGYVEQHVRA